MSGSQDISFKWRETHWYERGKLHWLWVAVSTKTAVFHIGSRRKEELSYLVKEAFVGWLVTDGKEMN